MNNGSVRRLLACMVLCSFVFFSSTAFACTSLIVGKDASESGYPMFSRTEDSVSYSAKRFFVYPAGYYKKGQTIVDPSYGWKWTWTHDSYRMTATPDMPVNGPNVYDQAGVNEHGFMMSTTNTTTISSGAKAADPLVKKGFAESLMNTVLLGESASSEEAISLCAKITETDGMSEMCFWMMCDSKGELWVMENAGGHRWVAARVPDDSFAVVANDNVIDYVDLADTKNFRGSSDLITFAVQKGFAVYGKGAEAGKVNIAASYGNQNGAGSSYRRWIGYKLFAPSQNIALKYPNPTDPYPYKTFVKPDKKISALDIMEFQRSRFENTPYDISESPQVFITATVPGVNMLRETETAQIPNVSGDAMITARPIGHYTQKESHIYEWIPGIPPEIGGRWWFLEGQPEHSVNLPFYGNINDTHPAYKKNVTYRAYDPESAFWIFREVSYLARANRKMYGHAVHDYWHAYEKKLYAEQESVTKELIQKYKANPKDAAEWITNYTFAAAQAAMNRAGVIRSALVKHMAANPDSIFVVPSDSIPFINGTFDIHPTAGTANLSSADIYDAASILGISEWTVHPACLKLPSPYPAQKYTPILYTTEEVGNLDFLNKAAVLPIPGVKVYANLASTDLSAGNLVKVRYTAELQGKAYSMFDNSVENVKNMFSLYASLPGYENGVELAGPNGLVKLSDAVKTGKAWVIGDKNRATVMIDFYLYDDAGSPAYGAGGKIVVPDGKTDGILNTGVLFAAKQTGGDSGGGGCNAAYAGFALLALIPLLLRRKQK